MTEDTRILRENIRDTRERMSNTLDELGERLNPNRLKQQAKDSIREATVGRVTNMASNAGNSVMDTIRDNPIPAAMIGIGLGWLLFNGRRSHDLDRYRERHGLPYQGDVGATTPRLRQDDAAGGVGASVSPADNGGALHRVGDAVGDVRERVGEKVSDLGDRAQHMAHDVADSTRHQARRIEDRFQHTLQDNPLAIGVAAAAVGLAMGLAIPETRKEAQVMGSTRDRLMDRVRDTAEDVGEKVQRVAERAVSEAEEGAREEGLS